MASNATPADEKVGDFELICSLKSNDLFPVHKYKSSVTGLTVVIAEVEGPVVNGYFCLATEAHDDDGLPHTLEHLIFLGSEKYPYKGVLDLLANRCLASGTNAWTDVDHTCYTMTTAGIEGFLSLLPIYLDHILYPTLTDSGFATEVHHVTGSGEDGGVVYCEMQGRETTAESLTQRALAQALYPGACGYSAETGGILSNLRESTSNVKVRAYHREFYRPENLTLVVAGAATPAAILSALSGRRDNEVQRPAFQRPWQDPVPPLTESVDIEVLFPCDDEESGAVRVGWRGPSAVTEMLELAACAVLLKYLTDTSVSPLAAAFVETEDPLASSVSFSLVENRETALVIELNGVPSAKLQSAPAQVLARLRSLDMLDMPRLRSVLRRHALETLSFLEAQPHSALAFALIGDMLHGESEADLSRRMNAVAELRALSEHPESFWLALLRSRFDDAPSVSVRARPSRSEQQRLEAAEAARVAGRVAELGAEGLARRQAELEEAMKNNEVPPPNAMLTSVPVPSVDGIRFIPVTSFESGSAVQHRALDLRGAPVLATLDHLAANFVYLTALLDTSSLTEAQRGLLPLLLELLTESPVRRGETLVPHATVVAELEADTVAASAGVGVGGSARFACGPFSSTATLDLQLEPGKLTAGLRWLRELLFATELTVDRVRVVASKMVNDVARAKRKGNKVAQDLLRSLCFAPESNHVHGGAVRQHRALTALLARLDSDGAAAVLAELEAARQELVAPKRMALHVAADADRLGADAVDPWAELLPKGVEPEQAKLHVVPDWSQLSPNLKLQTRGGGDGCIVGLGCVESCFISHAVPSITDPEDPDLAPLLVFLQYLTQLEGAMWRRVRGAGLAYGYSVVPRPHEGLLHLSLYRATNGAAAFREMRDICTLQLGPDAAWDPALLAAARSSLVFEVVDRERSVGSVVAQSLMARFRGVSQQYNRELVRKVAAVTEADLARVGPLHVAPLFAAGRTRTAIVCPPARVAELTAAFLEMGCNLSVSTLEDSFLTRC